MVLLVTGAFLPGMALALGASNFTIGVLASFAPIAQIAQIPGHHENARTNDGKAAGRHQLA